MKKYLYLTQKNWVSPWINGGVVPLYAANKYLSEERSGVFTPDENLIDTSTHDIKKYSDFFSQDGTCSFTVKNSFLGGVFHDHMHFEQKTENGLVLCLSNKKRARIALKLGKEACVKILDVELLKQHLDEQIGMTGIMKSCEYTNTHKRNHFLKSSLDAWQNEFRVFWPGVESLTVTIPPGIAKEVKL